MSNRTYSQALNDGKGAPTFGYIYDQNLVYTGAGTNLYTGAWRKYTTADISNSTVNVSGLALSVSSVAVTGGQINILGGPVTVANGVVPVSGTSVLLNTAPIPVSGVFTIPFTNPVFVTGSFSSTSSSPSAVLLTGSSLVGITGGTLNVAVTGGVLSASSSSVSLTGFSPTLPALPISGFTQSNVINTSPIPVSGVINIGTSVLPVLNSGGYIGVTGVVTTNSTIVGAVVIPIVNSGGYVGVTGTVATNANITNTAPLAISGIVQATVSVGNIAITGFNSTIAPLAVSGSFTSTPGNSAVTGGNINITDNLGWALLSGISGALTTNLSGAAYVTGNVNIGTLDTTHTYLPVSGINFNGTLTSSNPIGITGTFIDKALPTILTPPSILAIGGRVINPSGAGSITGYNSTGDMAVLNISPAGGLYVTQGVLDPTQDIVSVIYSGNNVAPVAVVSGLASTTALPANPNRISWGIQNLSTGALMLNFGSVSPTTGACHLILAGGTVANDGKGASYIDNPCVWRGAISVSGVNFILPTTYTAWQY